MEQEMSRDSFLDIPPYPGKQKPRSHLCFKPGDLIYFVKEGEIGLLTKRFDIYEKDGLNSKNPSWAWRILLTPNKATPWLCSGAYGTSEINLYNCMGQDVRWVPAK